MNFTDLGLRPEILRAVDDVGYSSPTPIQEQAIPYVLQGRDVLGVAQTGTGKTAGFTLPMIDILANGRARARMPRSLILEPTRELAAQVAENFETYGKYEKLTCALLIGGESFDDQIRKLDRGVDVLIATPGRMLDLFERGKVLLADVRILVIDEADRMLDMGFIPDIERIVSLLPAIRQTLFFSATMPPEIRRLADAFLMNPKQISVSPMASTADTVEQFLVVVDQDQKRAALRQLLRQEQVRNALVFCNRKRDVSVVCASLQRHGFNAGQLHGDLPQPTRTETLDRFKEGDIQVLVCSDVAARGIDIAELSHVFNFDVPFHAEDYIHRIGRTGRAGRSGRAFMIATREDRKFLEAVKRLIKREMEVLQLDGMDLRPDDEPERPRRSRGRPERRATERRPSPLVDDPAEAREADAEEIVPETPVVARPARQPRPAGPSARPATRDGAPRERRPPRERETDRERDDVAFGLGDHVPAFLLRPVPKQARRSLAGD